MNIGNFHNVRFPTDVSYGSSGGPGFKTTVIELSSGHEQRNIDWSLARATYDAAYGVKERYQMEEVLDFFYARRGKAYGFRYKDWMDYSMDLQQVGVTSSNGEAINMQIFKRYEPGTPYFYDRPILKIVPGTQRLFVDHIERNPDFIDVNTGLINIGSQGIGKVVEVECEFDVPVRFDTDEIKINHDDWELMSWPSVPLIELKPR